MSNDPNLESNKSPELTNDKEDTKIPKVIPRRNVLIAGGIALGLGGLSLALRRNLFSLESEPIPQEVPLIVDFSPNPYALKEERSEPEALLSKDVRIFNLERTFNRIAKADYTGLQNQYHSEQNTDVPLEGGSGIDFLLENNREKEAICLSLLSQWSFHGAAVAGVARSVRVQRNQELKKDKAQLKELPLLQYPVISLEDHIQSFEKIERTDQFGNPYYEVGFDHIKLAEAIKKMPQKIINCSFNLRKTPVRVAYSLPEGQLENREEGWINGKYSGTPGEIKNGMVSYEQPAIALETAYNDPENIEALIEFAKALPDKIIVTASGNSACKLPPGIKLPDNCIMVSAWDSKIEKPTYEFYGEPGTVVYVDPIFGVNASSFATATVSEWLTEQGVQNAKQAKELLQKHSRIQIENNIQILDLGRLPNVGGINTWDDPKKYKPIK